MSVPTPPPTDGQTSEPEPSRASKPVRVPVSGPVANPSGGTGQQGPRRVPVAQSPLSTPVPRIAGEEETTRQAPRAPQRSANSSLPRAPRGPKPSWYVPPQAEVIAPTPAPGAIVGDAAPKTNGVKRVPVGNPAARAPQRPVTPRAPVASPVTPSSPVADPAPVEPVTVEAPELATEAADSTGAAPMGGWVPEWAIRPKDDIDTVSVLPGVEVPAEPVIEEDAAPVIAPAMSDAEVKDLLGLDPVTAEGEAPEPVEEALPEEGFGEWPEGIDGFAEEVEQAAAEKEGAPQAPADQPVTDTPVVEETPAEEEGVEEAPAVEAALPITPPALPLTRPLAPARRREEFGDGDGEAPSRGMSGAATRIPVTRPTLPATQGEGTRPAPRPVLDAAEQEWEEPTPEVNPDDVFPSDDPEGAAERASERKKNKAVGVKVTERDVALLQFLTRYRYATYPQIAGYLGTSVNALRQRFPRLAKAGLIVGDNAGQAKFLAWRPTETGVLLSGLDLPTPTLSWATAAHTLGLVDIGIRMEAAGETVVTEREIRAAETRERPTERMIAARKFYGDERASTDVDAATPMFVVHLGAGEGQFTHIPDMVLLREPGPDGAPQSVAIELELRRKPPTQWRKILRAYRDSKVFGYVVYYVHRRDIRDGIQKAAIELGMTHMIEVRKFTPADSTLPLPTN